MQAQLTISIDAIGLERLAHDQQHINIAHHARGPAGPMVSWLAIQDSATTNVVEWNPNVFAVYMTYTIPSLREPIQIGHAHSAELGWTYTFDGGGFFGFVEGPADVCTIVNQQGPNLHFGLAYRAELNGKSILAPISVAQLPEGRGEFAPLPEVSVFLDLSHSGGRVIPPPKEALTVTPDANVVFDDFTSRFRQAIV